MHHKANAGPKKAIHNRLYKSVCRKPDECVTIDLHSIVETVAGHKPIKILVEKWQLKRIVAGASREYTDFIPCTVDPLEALLTLYVTVPEMVCAYPVIEKNAGE